MHGAPCGMHVSRLNLHEDYRYMYLPVHCSNVSLDTATFTKPADFTVELLPLVARNRKI